MRTGTAYYPERASSAQWKRDFEKIRDAGMDCIRIGEFAWSRLEPREGEFCWGWLDESIALAGQYGIDVILCTPTACPPVWLAENYPDTLPVDSKGFRMVFGKRQHRCYNSLAYIERSSKIIEAMAVRYGANPRVIAWQLDNELGGERQRCYCANCERAFQKYLAGRYRDIDELNERWGNFFWSEDFQDFHQINTPLDINGQLLSKYNPSLELEFWRFSSRSIVNFCRLSAGILRKHTKAMITTNTDPFFYGDTVKLDDLFEELDIAGIDVYSEQPCEIGFYSDVTRSLKKQGRFWMTEYGVFSKDLHCEMNQLKAYGCEMLSFFKLNPFPWGQEQGTDGLLTLTGEPTKNYLVVKGWNEEDGSREQRCSREKNLSPERYGIYYDFESSWTYTIASWDPTPGGFVYPRYVLNTIYPCLFELGEPVRFAYRPKDIAGLEVLLLPMQVLYDQELEEALVLFVEGGGKLVVTEDLFMKNEDNVYLTKVPDIYRRLLGWEANLFVDPGEAGDGPVLLEQACGRGKTWMIRRDAGREQWKRLIESVKG